MNLYLRCSLITIGATLAGAASVHLCTQDPEALHAVQWYVGVVTLLCVVVLLSIGLASLFGGYDFSSPSHKKEDA